MRTQSDPVADEAIALLAREGGVPPVHALVKTLVLHEGLPAEKLPTVVLDYLAKTSDLPSVEPFKVARCETLFGLHGPELLLVLGLYSLPANYASPECADALNRSGLLVRQPLRRVYETTQLVIDIMGPGGLRADGRGIRAARKVRLMHAAVRYLMIHDARNPWDCTRCVPVNQEGLAGTVMTVSYLVLEGLRRIGVRWSPADEEAWMHVWAVSGRVMGLDESLIPADVSAARTLTAHYQQRQFAPSSEGAALTRALAEGFETLMPEKLFRGVPASFMHFFLDEDPLTGLNIAEMLEIPTGRWAGASARVLGGIGGVLDVLGLRDRLLAQAFGYLGRYMVESLLRVQGGGGRPPLYVPEQLRAAWRQGPRCHGR